MSESDTAPEHLIHMANDIAHFFAGNSDREAAIVGIANHIKSFWTTKMRRKLITELLSGHPDESLEDLPRQALRLLKEHPDFKPKQLLMGRSRTRFPVALKTALATAAVISTTPFSPIPLIPSEFTRSSSL